MDHSQADDKLCKDITEKFRDVGGSSVSYADIAKKAWEVGRTGLATKVSVVTFNIVNESIMLIEYSFSY